MLPKSVDKIRVENKRLEVTGEHNATGGIERGVLVSEETIHFLVEFKFVEVIYGINGYGFKSMDMSTFSRKEKNICSLHECLFNDFNWYVYVDCKCIAFIW